MLLLAGLLAGLAGAARAAEEGWGAEAQAAQGDLASAAAALSRARTDAARQRAVYRAAAAAEPAMAVMRATLREDARVLDALEARAERAHAAGQAALGRLAAQARAPLAAQAAQPAGPLAAARGAWLAAALGPAEAARAKDRSEELEEARRRDERRREAWSRARGARLGLRLARRGEMAGAARDLAGLRDAFDDFLALGPARDPDGLPQARPAAPGELPAPAPGPILSAFGARDELGQAETGVGLAAPGWTRPTAPLLASVRFAGPVGGHGLGVALEPSPGLLMILAGFAELAVREGDIVLPGDPLGQLSVIDPASEEILVSAPFPKRAFSDAMLYVEVREDGVPVDPARWFALPEGRAATP